MNRSVNLLLLLFCAIISTGCKSHAPISENRYIPKSPAFTVHPTDHIGTKLLDYDAIYIADDTKGTNRRSYTYYRFWPSGHVLTNYSREEPSRFVGDNIARAYLGYYRLDGRGIYIELFVPNTGRGRWDYGRKYGYIENHSIIFTNSTLGARSWIKRTVFNRHEISGMQRTPDW